MVNSNKRDINYHEGIYKNWKERVLPEYKEEGLSNENSKNYLDYIFDMEIGKNVSNKNIKGGRGYGRLNVIRIKLKQIMIYFQKRDIKDLTKISENKLLQWVNDLEKGIIKRNDGTTYKSPLEFVRSFKAFWRWWMKSNKKKGKRIPDLSEDLTAKKTENTFVYLSKDQVFNEVAPLMDDYKVDYGILLRVLFDSIIRFPTEIASLKAENCYEKDEKIFEDFQIVDATKYEFVSLFYSLEKLKLKLLNDYDFSNELYLEKEDDENDEEEE